MKTKYILYFLTFIIAFNSLLQAQVPKTISYQGLLTDVNGTAVQDGEYSLGFALYSSESEGAPLWQETQPVVIQSGIFNVILGKVSPLNIPFDTPLWLGITVGQSSELMPRIELTSSAYSFYSQNVADSIITSNKIADGQVVRSLNSIKDNVKIVGQDNIQVITQNDSIVISLAPGNGEGDITGVFAGEGLEGGGISGNVTLSLGNNSVTTSKIANNAVTNNKIANGQVVKTINGLKDSVIISGSGGATVTTNGDTIVINAGSGSGGNGVQGVQNTNNTLSVINPNGPTVTVNVRDGGIGTTQIANNSVTREKLSTDALNDSYWTITDNNMVSNVSGNVGIGTSNPNTKLHLKGGDMQIEGDVPVLTLNGSGPNKIISFKHDGSEQGGFIYSNSFGIRGYVGNLSNSFLLSTNGNFGIGTNSPQSKLSVAGNIESLSGGFKFPDGTIQTTASATDGHSLNAADSDPVDALFVDDEGKVGIGTTTPGSILSLRNFGTEISLWMRASGSWPAVLRQTNSSFLSLINGGSERLTVAPGGNIGFGTTSPLAKNHIFGNNLSLTSNALKNDEIIVESEDAVIGLYSSNIGENGSALILGEMSNGVLTNKWGITRGTANSGNDLLFSFGTSNIYEDNSYKMILTDDGNLGLGTVFPAAKLHLTGGTDAVINGGGYIIAGATSGLNLAIDNNEIMARSNGTTASLTLNADGGNVILGGPSGGNIGIGTTNPQVKLDVRGTISTNSEFHSNKTGNANLIPICYGNVSSDGSINTGTGNFSVERTSTGRYRMTINNEDFYFGNYIVSISPTGFVLTGWSSAGGKLNISFNNALGLAEDTIFSFIIYKP
jgi:hypothetical protein